MKKIKFFFAFMTIFALLFYSCSKDDNNVDPTNEKATLSFGAIVQDMANKAANKQALEDMPACTGDDAAYVHIVLSSGGDEILGESDNPFQVDLVAGQVYTKEVPELELEPGTYTLEHFSVYNSEGTLIWLAPRTGSELAPFVDTPLPLDISLGAGVKKYVDVPVLCYDDREVNQYGYLFFEFNETEAFEFCFFANYCPPAENGKHFTANYSVNIWLGTDNTGTPLYTNVTPVIGVNANEDFFAEPTCFALPANEDLDTPYLYYEVTLLDWPENYGTVAPNTVLSGTLTAQDVMDNFDGEDSVNYEHLRFNCPPIGGGDCPEGDMDGDGICDDDDNCPNNANPDQTDTDGDGIGDVCDDTPGGGDPCPNGDLDGDKICDDVDNCPEDANEDQANSDGDPLGDVCDNCPNDDNEDQMDTDDDGLGDVCDNCPENMNENQEDIDEDGFGDVCDNCPEDFNPFQLDSDHDGIGNACDPTPGDDGDVLENCETAIMFGDTEWIELGITNSRWGWTEHFEDEGDGEYVYQIWAGAGQNNLEKGYYVGQVILNVDGENVSLELVAFTGNQFDDIHVYFGDTAQTTIAPGQFDNTPGSGLTYELTDADSNFWFTVHIGEACPEN